MCNSPDLWATPQQLQWELSEEYHQPQNTAEQQGTVQANRWPAASTSQMQAAVLEFGLDAVQSASKAPKSRLAHLSQAYSASDQSAAPSYGSGFACGPDFNADPEYLEDFELSQSQSQPVGEVKAADPLHALEPILLQPSGAETCLGQSEMSQPTDGALDSPLGVAAHSAPCRAP